MFTDISTMSSGRQATIPAGGDFVVDSFNISFLAGQAWLEYSVFNSNKQNVRKGRVMVSYSNTAPDGDLPIDHPFTDDIGDTTDITFHATIDPGNNVEIKFSNADAVDWYVAYTYNRSDY